MLKRGQKIISHQVYDIAESVLSFSVHLRDSEEFHSEFPLKNILIEVGRKRRVAVLGEAAVGKSSILNLLTGETVFTTWDDSQPGLAKKWAYGRDCANTHQEGVAARYVPYDFLRDIDLFDFNGIDEASPALRLLGLLNQMDVIVFVIDARKDVHGNVWQLLSKMPQESYGNMVIAITHEDFFDYQAQQDIKAVVRKQSESYFGIEVPLFVVRAGGEQRQGGEALARRVNSILDAQAIHSNLNDKLVELTRSLLNEQKHVLHNQDRLSRLDAGFLSNIEREIDGLQDQITKILPSRLEAIGNFVRDCIPMLGRKCSRQLGYYLSIGNLDRLGRMSLRMDNWFYDYLRKGIEEQQEQHNKEFLSVCEKHWNYLRPLVKEQLDCEIGDFPKDHIRKRLDGYRKTLGRASYKPLVDFGLKPCLARLYSEQKGWMKKQLILVFMLLIAAGIIGGLKENGAGLVLLGCSFALWMFSAIILWFIRYRLTNQIVHAARDMNIAVREGLETVLYEATLSGVADYRKLFTNIRGYVAINANQLAPLMDRHNKLFYRLSAMTRRI